MLDEEMDHIIREAADKHHPAYNDKAWEQMELKLDKHLPQKKDRRRLIFFLGFFLLLGGGILFTVNKFSGGKNSTAEKNTGGADTRKIATTNNTASDNTAAGNTANSQDGNDMQASAGITANTGDIANSNSTPDKTTGMPPVNQGKAANSTGTELLNNRNTFGNTGKAKTAARISNPNLFEDAEPSAGLYPQKKQVSANTRGKQAIAITNAIAEEDNGGTGSEMVKTEKNEPATAAKTAGTNEQTAKEKEKNKDKEKESAKKAEEKPVAAADKKKNKNKPGSNFGFTVSVGPDMSFVKLNNTGKTTLTYGAGLSYDFAKRFTARAGFYVTKKIYQASPDEYHTPGGNYPNLTGVDANCKVYEIPVSISYNFGQRNKHNWFGNAGLSSFIMKKEDYTYNYKSPAGQTYTYYQELSNKNKHYFAVLTLSGGYKYQFTNRLSMQAEPYAKIPLGGVGQGKIKLSSAGVLFTVTYKPFKKKK